MARKKRIDARWDSGKAHHPMALQFREFLSDTGVDDELDLKFGGDGDNGEDILMALSEFFESFSQPELHQCDDLYQVPVQVVSSHEFTVVTRKFLEDVALEFEGKKVSLGVLDALQKYRGWR